MQQKFGVLRIVATIFKILAWIVLVLGIIGACGSLATAFVPGMSTGLGSSNPFGTVPSGLTVVAAIGAAIGALIGTLIAFLILYAYGDLISLLLALEENTRLTAERLTGVSGITTPRLSDEKA
jgi:hypothetical protein